MEVDYIATALRMLKDGRVHYAISKSERDRHEEEYKTVVRFLSRLQEGCKQ